METIQRCKKFVLLMLVIVILAGCDRPLPTEVTQGLTQAAPTIDVLIGTATTIAGQIAATLAAAQISTDVPLTAEAYAQDLSSTAAALVLPAVSSQAETTALPYPAQSSPALDTTEPLTDTASLLPVEATPAAVYPAAQEQVSAVVPEIAATDAMSPTLTVAGELPVTEVISATIAPEDPEAVGTETPAVVDTSVPMETSQPVETELPAVIVTVVVVEPELPTATEVELATVTETMTEPELQATAASPYPALIQQAQNTSEATVQQPAATEPVKVAVPVVASTSEPAEVTNQETAVIPAIQATVQSDEPSETAAAVQETETVVETTEIAEVFQQVVPDVYYLKRGEFPYCLARRFDIHPKKLMAVNGFYAWETFYAGLPVVIPQNARSFPGERALRSHPQTHRVRRGETIYTIACYYGDIDPLELAWLNGLQHPYRLSRGQVLQLPETR